MKAFKKMIERIFTRKNMKIFLLVFVVLGFFIGSSFAQTSETASMTAVDKLAYLLRVLISILSWVWVVLATLAGKLMTNEFVYGTFLHLDRSLWQLWNIMKNFANYTLGFMLVFTIVKNLFKGSFGGSDDPIKGAKDTIIHTLIAGVLIQMSWFLIAALLDLSTIATAAVGALPSQFMASNTDFQNDMKTLISKSHTRLEIDFANEGDTVDAKIRTGINTDEDLQKVIDTIMPHPESVVGPLIFLGASVFNLYDLSDSSKNMSGTDDIGDLLLSLGINGFVLLSFSLMLALIFLFNLFRVITLWIIIPLMPFVILLNVFKKDKLVKDFGGKEFGGILDYKKIISVIFKPVYMTLVLSIVLIVMVLIRTLVKANDGVLDLQEHNSMKIQSTQVGSGYTSSLDIADIAEIKMTMAESIVDLIVYILGVALMFMLMKSCVSGDLTGIGFIDNRIKNISSSIWGEKGKFGGILGSVGVIPVGGGKKVGISKMREFADQKLVDHNVWANAVGIDLEKQDNIVSERIGSSFSSLRPEMDRDEWINKAVKIGKSKRYYSAEIMYSNDEGFQKALKAWNDRVGNVHIDVINDIKPVWEGGAATLPKSKTGSGGSGGGGGGSSSGGGGGGSSSGGGGGGSGSGGGGGGGTGS